MLITGSRAHEVYNAARAGRVTPRMQDLIAGTADDRVLTVAPVIWGRDNESVARWQFIAKKSEQLTDFRFQSRGLMLHGEHSFIGASVDGLYTFYARPGDGGFFPEFDTQDPADPVTRLLEIKCPFSIREVGVEAGAGRLRYLERKNTKTPEFTLKKRCAYYTQIQMYLAVYGLAVCTLVIWTPRDSLELEVPRDPAFQDELFDKLTNWYTGVFTPALFRFAH